MRRYFVVFTTHKIDEHGNEIGKGCRTGIATLRWEGAMSDEALRYMIEGRIQETLDKNKLNEVLYNIEYIHSLSE